MHTHLSFDYLCKKTSQTMPALKRCSLSSLLSQQVESPSMQSLVSLTLLVKVHISPPQALNRWNKCPLNTSCCTVSPGEDLIPMQPSSQQARRAGPSFLFKSPGKHEEGRQLAFIWTAFPQHTHRVFHLLCTQVFLFCPKHLMILIS